MFNRALVSPARAQLLEERARTMRFSPTRSEEWLWRRLSGFGWHVLRVLDHDLIQDLDTVVARIARAARSVASGL